MVFRESVVLRGQDPTIVYVFKGGFFAIRHPVLSLLKLLSASSDGIEQSRTRSHHRYDLLANQATIRVGDLSDRGMVFR